MNDIYINKKYGHPRSGEECRIISRGKGRFRRSVLVQFTDGFRMVTVQGHLRKVREER